MWPGAPLIQLDCRIIWLTISLEGINQDLPFFAWRKLSWEGSICDYHFWLSVASHVSCLVGIQDSVIISFSGRNQVIHSFYYCHAMHFFFIYILASFVKRSGGPLELQQRCLGRHSWTRSFSSHIFNLMDEQNNVKVSENFQEKYRSRDLLFRKVASMSPYSRLCLFTVYPMLLFA